MPRVEVEEIGPRIDFTVGRIKEADEATRREAMKIAKGSEAIPKKNVETDIVGDKIGRIHLGKQDLAGLQTRTMKGFKGLKRARDRDTDSSGDSDSISVSGEEEGNGEGAKRPRLEQ